VIIPGKLYQIKNAAFRYDGRPMPCMANIALLHADGSYSPYGDSLSLNDGDIVLVLPVDNWYSMAEVICLLHERIVFIQHRHIQPIQ